MKTIGIIPARAGSKGIKKKNVKLLCGKPLIQYTIDSAVESNLDNVVISTDCPDVIEIAKKNGIRVILRPEELCQDNSKTIDAINYTLNQLDEKFDSVMILQPTSPMRTKDHINESICKFDTSDGDSLVSVTKVPHNMSPDKIMNLENGVLSGNLEIKRRQEIKEYYARNGAAIYITKTSKITEYIFGGKIIPYFMSKAESFDIDDQEDWEIVEKLLS